MADKLKTFNVLVVRTITQSRLAVIEAEDEDDANDKALAASRALDAGPPLLLNWNDTATDYDVRHIADAYGLGMKK